MPLQLDPERLASKEPLPTHIPIHILSLNFSLSLRHTFLYTMSRRRSGEHKEQITPSLIDSPLRNLACPPCYHVLVILDYDTALNKA